MLTPKVFISYSHDSAEHRQWVLELATSLRRNGIDVTLDQWDLAFGQDISLFMQRGITESDRVLMVCSDAYVRKSESGAGGVGYERLVVTAEVVQAIDTKKFIPLIRSQKGAPKTPSFLGPRLFIDLRDDVNFADGVTELSREILGIPANTKPPLGENPFSGKLAVSPQPLRTTGPTGATQQGAPVLGDSWFEKQHETAARGLLDIGLLGYMELRFALHDAINKSQIELIDSVRKSEIHTFGWPIAVTLENREEYRPRPFGDGIRAEISINNDGGTLGRKSYDYWALKNNGDFYLLQSLFEDYRKQNALFFNTRIVRVAEAFLFASNLYTSLGVDPGVRLSARVSHGGLVGRTLSSSSQHRFVLPKHCTEEVSQTELVVEIGRIRDTIVEVVQRVAEPLFMLFDFAQFERSVYDDIISRFVRGEVT